MSKDETKAVHIGPELAALIKKAEEGDATALPALRLALDEHGEVWKRYGDLALHVQQGWLALICGPNLALKEALERQLAVLTVTHHRVRA